MILTKILEKIQPRRVLGLFHLAAAAARPFNHGPGGRPGPRPRRSNMKLLDWCSALFLLTVAVLFVFKWITEPLQMSLYTFLATCVALSIYLIYFLFFAQPARNGSQATDSNNE